MVSKSHKKRVPQNENNKKNGKIKRFLLGDGVYCQGLMVGLFCRDQWGVGGKGVVDPWIGHLDRIG